MVTQPATGFCDKGNVLPEWLHFFFHREYGKINKYNNRYELTEIQF